MGGEIEIADTRVIRERHPTLDVAPDRLPEAGYLPPEAVVSQASSAEHRAGSSPRRSR
jgi:hypothetical protein